MKTTISFLPKVLPSISIDESGESTRIVRTGLFVIVFLVGGALLWSFLAPISGAVIAQAQVKIDANRKTVQSFDGGIIKEILVKEGSVVEKDQPLLRLEDTTSSSNLNILATQLDVHKIKEARLSSEKNLQPTIAFPSELIDRKNDKVAEIMESEKAAFLAKRKSLDDQVRLLRGGIEQTKQEISGIKAHMSAINESIGYIKKQITASEALYKKKFIEQSQIWKLKRSISEKKEELAAQKAKIAETREKLGEIELRIIVVQNNYVQEAEDEIKETRKEIFDIYERLRPAKNELARHVVTAPITGQVINLQVFTIGGVIRPGETLLDIVPNVTNLIIEARVETKDIDDLFVSQKAEIQLSAFNRRTTPLVGGEVVYISGDILEDDDRRDTPYYLVHIRVNETSLQALGDVKLFPGMPATAFIKTIEKTFADYMLSPIVDNFRRAFREG